MRMNLLTVPQASVRIRVPERTVRLWCKTGRLKALMVGGSYLIDPEALKGLERPRRRPRTRTEP